MMKINSYFLPLTLTIALVSGCSGSSSDNDSPAVELIDAFEPLELFDLVGENDGVDLSGEGALFTVTTGSDDFGGAFFRTNDPVSDQISLKFIYNSTSTNAGGGDSRITLQANLFNSIADGGNGTGENGTGGDAEMSLRVRNRSDGTMDVLACAFVENADGTVTPFVTETEDGDGDGCAGLDWFFGFDTEHTLTIGVNRENQSVLLGFDDDIREFPSLIAMNEAADGFASVFVGARGDGSFAQIRVTSLDTGIFVDTEFESLESE